MMKDSGELYIVGQDVRVDNIAKTLSSKALISFVNDDGTLDVIYASKTGGVDSKDEDSGVSIDRVHALEPFELTLIDPKVVGGDTLKEYGNKLFSLKDFRSALDVYRKALTALTHKFSSDRYSVGSVVLVSMNKSIDYKIGMVSDIVDSSSSSPSYEVMYDEIEDNNDGEKGAEEESGVSKDRLTLVSSDVNDRSVQRAVYLNMARCYLKLNEPGWAIKTSSIALHITLHILYSGSTSDVAAVKKQLVDAYYFRAKALLSVNRPGFAAKDMNKLKQYDKTKAAQLEGEINQHRTRMSKINKKLAKDVAKWVDTALAGINNTGSSSSSGLGSGDLDITNDLGEEEDEAGTRLLGEYRANEHSEETKIKSEMPQSSKVGKSDDGTLFKIGVFVAIILVFHTVLQFVLQFIKANI